MDSRTRWKVPLVVAITLFAVVPSCVVISAPGVAQAVAPCNSPGTGNKFAGYAALNGYNGHTYRGVVGNIATRDSQQCFGDYSPERNFSTAWYMIAGKTLHGQCGTNSRISRGYAQAGYFHGIGELTYPYAETNPDGCAPVRRVKLLDQPLTFGSNHRYTVSWYWWANVMAMQYDGRDIFYSNFDPVAYWGTYNTSQNDAWEPQAYGETDYVQSNVPGQYGSSCFFSAMGSWYDGNGWVGTVGLNGWQNDVPSRWFVGPLNEFNPSVYGLNFQIGTYDP